MKSHLVSFEVCFSFHHFASWLDDSASFGAEIKFNGGVSLILKEFLVSSMDIISPYVGS